MAQDVRLSHDPETSVLEARFSDDRDVWGLLPTMRLLLGQTDAERKIFLVFTIRKRRIPIISARDMSAEERRTYHEQVEAETDVQD